MLDCNSKYTSMKNNIPSITNYLSVLIGTQILRNLYGICKNIQLQSNLGLNELSNELREDPLYAL
jgi:hypothetical protein